MGNGMYRHPKWIGMASLVAMWLFSTAASAQLVVTPQSFSFPDAPVGSTMTGTIVIENTNPLTITLPVSGEVFETDCGPGAVDIPWMTADPVSFTLPSGMSTTVVVSDTLTGYPAGTLLHGNLCIGGQGGEMEYANVPTDICIGGNCLSAIPTVKEWGMAILALLLFGGAAFEMRRRLS